MTDISLNSILIPSYVVQKHQSLNALEGKAVQIGLQDGRLTPEICADASDTIDTINFKRAIASLIQVSTV